MIASLSIGCNTDDLDPALEQNKDPRVSISKVDNLYALIKGAYSRMTGSGYYGRDLIVSNEVRTNNVFSNGNSGRFITEAGFNYSPTNTYFWDDAYRVISSANLVINTDLTQLEGDQDFGKHLQGQAYALRALAHFDLLKQFGQQHVTGGTTPGGIPYVTTYRTSDSSQEDLFPPRNTVEEVKTKIYEDLNSAFNLLEDTGEKNFFSKYAAKALEARVATYFGDWPRVITTAEDVINNTSFAIVPSADFVNSFASDGGNNIIFELEFSEADNQGSNSLAYIYRGSSYGDIQVIDDVLNLFEPTDVRGLGGILGYEGSMLRNLGKYPDNQGYDNVAILRYEELILNYAEALFETGGDALTQLNKIPAERGATLYAVASKENILLERRKELMFEGFYYDDLLRTGSDIEKTSAQQNILTTIPYGDHRLSWAIPRSEMDANSNMIQNKGY
ncbi:RagB/SusD family nutrient uptake outer membrane protein [Oceanihabitans sp. IOP_32]|uniref:RagB/SusD family nutrient uptake outer membrane protein n=1 Tax=Oceanihabitans sp. IOP_32 TaxID=2529032 RepID=UPI001D17805A|nr:RagB/SusD family nutrient uptake outer membrane protein [Oceanihabitans sp. IOP_32]